MISPSVLATLYREAHNAMRNLDGLQPQDAFDELQKYLIYRQASEAAGTRIGLSRTLNFDGGIRLGDPQAAKAIRRDFSRSIKTQPGALELWPDARFKLSDDALLAVHELFIGVEFSSLAFDVRSSALRMFLGPDLRRGLGIYLTPDDVVRTIVEACAPEKPCYVLDPACGSGTFLIETLKYWRARSNGEKEVSLHGADINMRMLVLASLNIGYMDGVKFESRVQDALGSGHADWVAPNTVDLIVTNPPFGVYVDPAVVAERRFLTAGKKVVGGRVQSEVLFIEQCLRWLRPGGLLAIIVPRSVITNESLAEARAVIDEQALLVALMTLPPETFAGTGTQTNTAVLFLKKRLPGPATSGEYDVPVLDVMNVGYDSTGRLRDGSELPNASRDLRASLASGRATGAARAVTLPLSTPLSALGQSTSPSGRTGTRTATHRLGDIVSLAQTGRTPPRAAYTDHGTFILKVGNLSGQGIDWTPRERNFVESSSASSNCILQEGDIVLTSSAHHPKYIAQKVDIVHSIPDYVGGRATFVGEVMRLRVLDSKIDPYQLLALLRMPTIREDIQAMVRGQTAHLRPKDLLELRVPIVRVPVSLTDILRREATIAAELNTLMNQQRLALSGDPSRWI